MNTWADVSAPMVITTIRFCWYLLFTFPGYISVRMFTVEESLYSASKALDSYIECLGFWQCVAAC